MSGDSPILIDDRYARHLPKEFLNGWLDGLGVPLHLDVADVQIFSGDLKSTVMVEVKRPLDACVCLQQTGRLVAQMQAARAAGASLYVVLVQGMRMTEDRLVGEERWGQVDGKWRKKVVPVLLPANTQGEPLTTQYRALDNFLNTLAIVEGVQVRRTSDDRETAQALLDLWHWWQKGIEDHKSAARFYTPVYMPGATSSLTRRVAKEVPGIGLEKSRAVERRFGSVWEMVNAEVGQWMEIPGIGRKLAQGAYDALRAIHGRDGHGQEGGQ